MSNDIVFYDLPSRGAPKCWSLNPWKARAALNLKGLPYRTEWIEYPDIAPTFQKLNISKNNPETAYMDYTSPMAALPSGVYIMDSRKIASELEKLQPEPSLQMNQTDLIDRSQKAVLDIMGSLGPVMMVRVPENLLNLRSAEYFHETRAKRFGMPLKELSESEKGTKAWENAKPAQEKLKALLTETEGEFVGGKQVGFADFVIAGLYAFIQSLSVDGDLYDKFMGFDAAFPAHWKACEKWFERDN